MFLNSLQPQSKRILAAFCIALAALAGAAYLQLPWRETVNFDVTGFLWLIRNAPKLAAAVTFWTSLAAAVGLWLDAWLSR